MRQWKLFALLAIASTATFIALCVVVEPWLAITTRYRMALSDGTTQIREAQEMSQMLPGATHSIQHFNGAYGQPTWHSESLLTPDYKLILSVPVQLNLLRTGIVETGEPTMKILQITSSQPGSGGTRIVRYGDQWRVSMDRWRSFVTSGGDASLLTPDTASASE